MIDPLEAFTDPADYNAAPMLPDLDAPYEFNLIDPVYSTFRPPPMLAVPNDLK